MTNAQRNILLAIALFGLFVPNGMFIYYIVAQYSSVTEVLNNMLALGFIIDAFMVTSLMAWWFAGHPLGRYGWKVFVALSLIGGLGFSLPFFYYINKR